MKGALLSLSTVGERHPTVGGAWTTIGGYHTTIGGYHATIINAYTTIVCPFPSLLPPHHRFHSFFNLDVTGAAAYIRFKPFFNSLVISIGMLLK